MSGHALEASKFPRLVELRLQVVVAKQAIRSDALAILPWLKSRSCTRCFAISFNDVVETLLLTTPSLDQQRGARDDGFR
jgi:hypothetical protein